MHLLGLFVFIVLRGTTFIAIKIVKFCADCSIRLEVQWIPRTENEKADYSRLVDFDA